jgi:hypothetical protein
LDVCEARFQAQNLLPNISSKYKRKDRGFSMLLQTQRDPNALIGACHGELKAANELGYKPNIKGNIDFDKQTARKSSMTICSSPRVDAPDIYSYANSVSKALMNVTNPRMKMAGTTMQKATGRDNKMYDLSEHNNLNQKEDNVFGTLISLSNLDDRR